MRKWELITDLFDNKAGDLFPEHPQDHLYKGLIGVLIGIGTHFVDPKRYPQHFRLKEEPEFTERDMKEAMECAISKMSSYGLPVFDYSEIIETIRKRKAGKS